RKEKGKTGSRGASFVSSQIFRPFRSISVILRNYAQKENVSRYCDCERCLCARPTGAEPQLPKKWRPKRKRKWPGAGRKLTSPIFASVSAKPPRSCLSSADQAAST